MTQETKRCTRCLKKIENEDFLEELGFKLCSECSTNTDVKLGNHRWALILWSWYCTGWNPELELPSFWPRDKDGTAIPPDKLAHIALGLK